MDKNIYVVKISNTYSRIVCENVDIMMGLIKKFSVFAHNYFFSKKFKLKIWDGKIHFVQNDGSFLNGLMYDVLDYLNKQVGYTVVIDPKLKSDFPDAQALKEEFVSVINDRLGDCPIIPRHYQWRAALKSIYFKRMVCEHCTSSGKSLTMALIIHFLRYKYPEKKILVLVPRLDLVEQLTENFIEFKINPDELGKYTGIEHDEEKPIVISTWQSMHAEHSLLKRFHVLMADECHSLAAKEVGSVGIHAINADYRLGFTGTLPIEEKKTEIMQIFGVLGPVKDKVSLEELIESKEISDLRINVAFLKYTKDEISKYNKDIKQFASGKDAYNYEKNFIYKHAKRNGLLIKISKKFLNQGKNVLILLNRLDHSKLLVEQFKKFGIDPYVANGNVNMDDRNAIRKDMENQSGKVIIATVGVFAVGISIKKLHCIIFASAGKSKIETLQSVGRGLRLHASKDMLYLYDIVDDLKYGRDSLEPRMMYYTKNSLKVQTKDIDLDAEVQEYY